MKKICILVPTHWDFIMGGAQYQAKILIDRLIQRGGYEIYYLANRVNPLITPSEYKIVKIGDSVRFKYYRDAPQLLGALRDIKPDVIWQHVGCAYTGIAAYYAKGCMCRFVWHIASDKEDVIPLKFSFSVKYFLQIIDKKILEYGIRRSDAIIAQTKTQFDLLKLNYKLEPTSVIANFHPEPTECIEKSKKIKVLWVANFKRLKQPEIFIQLAQELSDLKNVEFLMIGAAHVDVQWQQMQEEQISAIENLHYLGEMPQEEVNLLFAASHILVNTSEYEGFSNTFIQAWMRKVPVLSLIVNPDNVFDNEFLGNCAFGSYQDLKKYTIEMITNDVKRERIGEQAYVHALENYSMKNVDRLIEILDQ